MQRKLAALCLSAIVTLAATVQLACSQQPAAPAPQQRPSPASNALYEDRQWSPNEDIQLLKNNLRSQKKQIVALNMDLTDQEAEKFWPIYDRYPADLVKIYDSKIAFFPGISRRQ